MKKIILFCLLFISSIISGHAQPAMAETMRSDGKIYVVVGVVVLIFIVLFSFLVYLDRRLAKLEKKQS